MKKLLSFFILFIFFISCNEDATNPTDNYIVSGKLIHDGKPLPNATVSLNDQVNLSAQSDLNGTFEIKNVPGGDYNLNVIRTNPDGSFINKNYNISVQNDVFLESLILPKGVILFELENVGSNSLDIK